MEEDKVYASVYYHDALPGWQRALACCINYEGEEPHEREITILGTVMYSQLVKAPAAFRKQKEIKITTNGDGLFNAGDDTMKIVPLIEYIEATFSCFSMTIRETLR